MVFEVASLIVANLIIAALIGGLIGFFIGKNSCKIKSHKSNGAKNTNQNSESKTKTEINPIFKKNSSLDNKPLVMSFPKPTGKDNLKKIKGIDNAIETDLNSLGIYHFDQIASWSNKNCDWVEAFLLQPGCAKQNQWVEQAKILKSGKETIYSQKVENGEIEVE